MPVVVLTAEENKEGSSTALCVPAAVTLARENKEGSYAVPYVPVVTLPARENQEGAPPFSELASEQAGREETSFTPEKVDFKEHKLR